MAQTINDQLYDRQKNLTLMKYSHVMVVGCGGIGNWVALNLALSGCVQNIHLVDPDIVEETNLNRTMFEMADVGSYKVDAVASQIYIRRPEQNINVVRSLLTENNVKTFIDAVIHDNSYYHSDVCIVDCRDDVFDDCYCVNCKLYKVGYDGMNISIDGNPRLTKVFGQRGGSYSVVPSYVGSAQLAAVLVTNDMLYPRLCHEIDKCKSESGSIPLVKDKSEMDPDFSYLHGRPNGQYDELGRLNDVMSFNCVDIKDKFVSGTCCEYVRPYKT